LLSQEQSGFSLGYLGNLPWFWHVR
jgi:hypothetical protein